MGSFAGWVQIGNTINVNELTKNSGGTPTNADALPTFRVYGPAGAFPSGFVLNGTCAFKDTGSVTNASNASPIQITSANHGLTTGARVTITGVLVNTNANGTFVITVVDANNFTLNGTTGNGAYGGGGVWNVTGLYTASIAATGANGFASGQTYTVVFNFQISGTNYGDISTFVCT